MNFPKSRVAGISGVLLLLALAFHLVGESWSLTGRDITLITAAAVAGAPIAVSAWRALVNRVFSIDLLVTIAVTGALIIGEYVESAVVAFLFVFGAWLEARTLEKTRRSVRELVDLAPREATVVRDGGQITIPADEVEVGERVIVRVGGMVPVDGPIVHGSATIDEATITGEPVPATKNSGDQAWSGTVVDSGYVELEAERVGEDTTFSQIIELVEDAQDSKAKRQRWLDKFAAWYTPTIVGLSVLAFIWTRDLSFALTFLVIACPGALVISTPVSLVAGLGNAARHNALLKGGDALERLAKFDTLVLDKTGTLTEGRPEVTEVVAAPGYSQDEVLRMAGALEQASEHPLGRTLVTSATSRGLDLGGSPAGVDVVTGAGITGLVSLDESLQSIGVGSERLLAHLGIGTEQDTNPLATRAQELEQAGNTVSFVTIGGSDGSGEHEIAGLVAIADQIRPGVPEALRALREGGVNRFVMLTGDNSHTAAAIAAQAGFSSESDEVRAELLPQEKLDQIVALKQQGGNVAMIGDGVNDAPAIAAADVGLAMGAGTDVSLETADVILVGNRFDQLLQARAVSRATLRNMTQNMVIALGTVALLLIGVVGGKVHMASGMLIHEISVVAVVLNAMRLIAFQDRAAARLRPHQLTASGRPRQQVSV